MTPRRSAEKARPWTVDVGSGWYLFKRFATRKAAQECRDRMIRHGGFAPSSLHVHKIETRQVLRDRAKRRRAR